MWRHLLSSPKLFTITRTLLPETALQTVAHRKILLPPPTRGLLLASLLKQTVSLSTSTQSPSSDLSNTNESKHSRNTNYESNNKTPSSDSNGLVITCEEAKRVMRLVNVEDLKLKLAREDRECVSYNELITSCQSMGVARSFEEAVAFVRVLDDAGVVFLFRDKVYLQPHKVINLVKRALPVALTPEDDPLREELKRLCEKKKEIDALAHKYVRRILWCGLGFAVTQLLLFFRLTYWEFSWDVLEPVAFFVTTSGLVVGYAYFLCTAKDPTYQDLRKRLFLSRQRKLFKKLDFDIKRYKELERKFSKTLDSHVLEDALNDD